MGSTMKRKYIVIGTPSFGTVSAQWAAAYRTLATPMNSQCFMNFKIGLEVGTARNAIVAETLAMDPQPTHVFFLDDDVVPPTPFLIRQLIKDDKPIVSGVYFTKNEFSEPVALLGHGEGTLTYIPGSGLHEVKVPSMGCCLIQTEVFRKMRDECDLGTDELGNPRWYLTRGDDPGEPDATEDSWFCDHAREAGYATYVDTSPYCFCWHWDNATNSAFPRPQWEEFQKTKSVSWEVPDGDPEHLLRHAN